LLILAGISLSGNSLLAQNLVEIAGGIGLPECINLKLKIGIKNQVGIAIGTENISNQGSVSYTLDFYHHFTRKDTSMSKWYWNGGLSLFKPNEQYYHNIYFIYGRVGRTISFSKNAGINIDIGIAYGRVRYTDIGPIGMRGNRFTEVNEPVIFPAFSINLFLKL
jgi:hypothetical protein